MNVDVNYEFRFYVLIVEEILKEGGVRKEVEMRYFIGLCVLCIVFFI